MCCSQWSGQDLEYLECTRECCRTLVEACDLHEGTIQVGVLYVHLTRAQIRMESELDGMDVTISSSLPRPVALPDPTIPKGLARLNLYRREALKRELAISLDVLEKLQCSIDNKVLEDSESFMKECLQHLG